MKRKPLKLVFSLLGVLLVTVAFSSLSFKQKVNTNPLPDFYKKGVYHLHSTFSDGRGDIAAIRRAAASQHLDFVMLTDHGRPNLRSSAATGWNDGVLLIGASEFSLHAGHLAAAGYRVPGYIFPPEPQEAIDEVGRDGGVTFIAHPLDGRIPWTDWRVHGFTGIEIVSLYQRAKANLPYALTLLPLHYLFNPDYALTALLSYPEKELRIWDRFNRQGNYYGIYALDSHAKIMVSKKSSLHFPSYQATFRILTIYVKLEHELEKDPDRAASAILAAIGRGNFFNVIESLAPANGFEHYYRENDGRRVDMGGQARHPGGSLVFNLPFDFPTVVVIRKDGGVFKTIRAGRRQELSIAVAQAGVYRSEITLASGRFKKLPWILANPVFVAMPAVEKKSPETIRGTALADGRIFFLVEKNNRSSAALQRLDQAGTPPVTALAFTLRPEGPGQRDFWVALAHRQTISASGYHGFVFETRSSRPMRIWLQFRTGDAAFQHSFLADSEWRQVAIPFSSFHCLHGGPPAPAAQGIDSFFFLIDNGNAYPNAAGEIFFRQVGLY